MSERRLLDSADHDATTARCLRRALDAYLNAIGETDHHDRAAELKEFLWHNKVGIALLCERAIANGASQ
jgi:hypothetical protein